MNATQRTVIMQRWNVMQYDLIPELKEEVGVLTPKLEKVIHTLEWVRIEEFVKSTWCGMGRPPHDRKMLASAFVAKTVLGLKTTAGLIERLTIDRALKRICGFSMRNKLPHEACFSRAFAEFAKLNLAERAHESLIKAHLGETLIGHISRDGTAIEAREKPKKKEGVCKEENAHDAGEPEAVEENAVEHPGAAQAIPCDAPKAKRGRKKSKSSPPPPKRIEQQSKQTLAQMLGDLPTGCDRGSKCNAQGYKNSWNGYKLHIDTADCGVAVSALLSSASMHDSGAAIPLALMTANRVTNCYDLMDAAYCSETLRAHSRSLGHVPLIDHNPRRGEKKEFMPHEAVRYNERTQAERTNARLKDEFGANDIWVRGHDKVKSHLMFGLLALAADQLMRLLT